MTTRKTCAVLAALLWITGAAWAEPAAFLKPGMPFQQARRLLLKEGWRPHRLAAQAGQVFIGTETQLAKAGIRELESCAVDRPLCLMHYRRGQQCLSLVTRGEVWPALAVDSWQFQCPVEEPPPVASQAASQAASRAASHADQSRRLGRRPGP